MTTRGIADGGKWSFARGLTQVTWVVRFWRARSCGDPGSRELLRRAQGQAADWAGSRSIDTKRAGSDGELRGPGEGPPGRAGVAVALIVGATRHQARGEPLATCGIADGRDRRASRTDPGHLGGEILPSRVCEESR